MSVLLQYHYRDCRVKLIHSKVSVWIAQNKVDTSE